jgi:hypothetical protein
MQTQRVSIEIIIAAHVSSNIKSHVFEVFDFNLTTRFPGIKVQAALCRRLGEILSSYCPIERGHCDSRSSRD